MRKLTFGKKLEKMRGTKFEAQRGRYKSDNVSLMCVSNDSGDSRNRVTDIPREEIVQLAMGESL